MPKSKEEIAARKKAWHEANPDKRKASKLKYNLAHPERVKAQQKAKYEKSKEYRQQCERDRYHNKSEKEKQAYKMNVSKYNISVEDYYKLAEKQEQACAICKEVVKPLCIDHCHSTDIVRGLLCRTCNACLGMAKDNILILQSAIEYLKEFHKKLEL